MTDNEQVVTVSVNLGLYPPFNIKREDANNLTVTGLKQKIQEQTLIPITDQILCFKKQNSIQILDASHDDKLLTAVYTSKATNPNFIVKYRAKIALLGASGSKDYQIEKEFVKFDIWTMENRYLQMKQQKSKELCLNRQWDISNHDTNPTTQIRNTFSQSNQSGFSSVHFILQVLTIV